MPIIRFFYSYYKLKPANIQTKGAMVKENFVHRQGALMKIQWPDGVVGYGDLFPWTEMGDRALDEQLYDVTHGKLSPLLEQTMWLARRDGICRKEKRNILRNVPRVKNSFLISDPVNFDEGRLGDVKRTGYSTVKIKCGFDRDRELAIIDRMIKQMGFSVRLDFNSKLTFDKFKDFVLQIPEPLREKIEYVEDPFPFDPQAWLEANKMIPIAVDFEWNKIDFNRINGPMPFKVVVMKPSRQDIPKTIELVNKYGLRMVITSSLDHPVGIVHAVAVAGETKKIYPNILLDCGCFSHIEYQLDEFSSLLPKQGPIISEVPGFGVGFDELLEKQPWVELLP